MSENFKMIWITFQKEGIHLYPAAKDDPKLNDVSFLGYPPPPVQVQSVD
jgi:hypothetical protein